MSSTTSSPAAVLPSDVLARARSASARSAGAASAPAWVFTPHAAETADRRGFSHLEVLAALRHPEVTYTSKPYGEGRVVHQRGDVAVVVHAPTRRIVTVLWRQEAQWSDDEARARSPRRAG